MVVPYKKSAAELRRELEKKLLITDSLCFCILTFYLYYSAEVKTAWGKSRIRETIFDSPHCL